MTDWIANSIAIASGATATVVSVVGIRMNDRQRRDPADQSSPPRVATSPHPPADRPARTSALAATSRGRPKGFANAWIAVPTGVVLVAVIQSLFGSATGQAVAMAGLLAVVIVTWLVRRSSGTAQSSESLAGLLALLMLLAIVFSIVALPLAPDLRWLQYVVGLAVAALAVPWAMRRIAP